MARLLIGALAVLLGAGEALAQAPAQGSPVRRPWDDPDAKDIDETERDSRFWGRALHPDRERYKREIAEAAKLLASRRADDHPRAEEILKAAVVLEPDDPAGFVLLGHAHYLQREWTECAAAYEKVTAIDPKMVEIPLFPGLSGLPAIVDVALGECLSLAGDHEGAIVRLRRAIVVGGEKVKDKNLVAIPWRLGEAYMAMGRLEEAIAQLRRGSEMQGPINQRPRGEVLVRFALAAALDRDEQLGLAREVLSVLAQFDTGNALDRADLRVSPPEDVHYYKALVFETPFQSGERSIPPKYPERALALYRKFLHQHGNGPWARRARTHIAVLSRDPLSTAMFKQGGGNAVVDSAQAIAAIGRANEMLQRCVKDVPAALLEVNITQHVAGRKRRDGQVPSIGGASKVGAGTQILALETDPAGPDKVATAIQCVHDVAGAIKLPPPKGSAGEWNTVTFPVIWQGR